MNKQRKIGMSGVQWFLAIVGLLFFSSLIFLPPIFRAFLSDNHISESQNQETKLQTTTVCTKTDNGVITEYIIDSTDDIIDMFAQSVSTPYPVENQDIIGSCNTEAGLYQGIPGFHHGCRIDGDYVVVESRIQMSQYQNDMIPISFDFHEKASVLKSSFLEVGFQCETKEQ